jgi:hypothetical protein
MFFVTQPAYVWGTVKWQAAEVKVPCCRRCKMARTRRDRLVFFGAWLLVLLGAGDGAFLVHTEIFKTPHLTTAWERGAVGALMGLVFVGFGVGFGLFLYGRLYLRFGNSFFKQHPEIQQRLAAGWVFGREPF